MCQAAVELLKRVGERGEGDKGLGAARRAYEALDHPTALMHYLRLADMGLELGQSNAAWMLKHGYGCGPACALLVCCKACMQALRVPAPHYLSVA